MLACFACTAAESKSKKKHNGREVRYMTRGIVSINPANGEVLRKFEPHSDAEIERRLECAAEAFRVYRRRSIAERAHLMIRVAEILTSEKEKHARMITLEMGKLLRAAVQEVVPDGVHRAVRVAPDRGRLLPGAELRVLAWRRRCARADVGGAPDPAALCGHAGAHTSGRPCRTGARRRPRSRRPWP